MPNYFLFLLSGFFKLTFIPDVYERQLLRSVNFRLEKKGAILARTVRRRISSRSKERDNAPAKSLVEWEKQLHDEDWSSPDNQADYLRRLRFRLLLSRSCPPLPSRRLTLSRSPAPCFLTPSRTFSCSFLLARNNDAAAGGWTGPANCATLSHGYFRNLYRWPGCVMRVRIIIFTLEISYSDGYRRQAADRVAEKNDNGWESGVPNWCRPYTTTKDAPFTASYEIL